jgi:quercetin dioxygenase-like cupin family protein
MAELEGVTVSRREGRPLNRDEAEKKLGDEGLKAEAWQNGPDYNYIGHEHPYTKVLYCVVGNIVFHVRDASGKIHDIALEPGDRIEIGSGIVHSASVGPNGVICVEAARES